MAEKPARSTTRDKSHAELQSEIVLSKVPVSKELSNNSGLGSVLIVILIALISVVLGQYYHKSSFGSSRLLNRGSEELDHKTRVLNEYNTSSKQDTDWRADPDLSESMLHLQCQFPIYFATKDGLGIVDSEGKIVDMNELLLAPAILKGFMNAWPAMNNGSWSRSRLINKYGKKVVVLDSSTVLAYSDRKAELKFYSLQKSLAELRKPESEDMVIYDTGILHSVSELRRDYDVPRVFQDWEQHSGNKESGELEHSWHVLNIGASRSGLPFHSHGRSYSALVHGLKRWFAYPPGYGPPYEVEERSNPLLNTFDWLTKVYPLFDELGAKYPPQRPDYDANMLNTGYRPLECVQRPGDILYLPAGWLHQTLNIGETIGIGLQSVFDSTERYTLFTRVLKHSPNNFDAMRNAGISAAYLAMEEETRVKMNIAASTTNGMVLINPQRMSKDMHNLVLQGEDTWFMQYFLQGDDRSRALALLWNRVAGALKGLMSVGAVEVPNKQTNPDEYAYVVEAHKLSDFMDEEGKFKQQVIRTFLGNRHTTKATTLAAAVSKAITLDPRSIKQEESGIGIGPTCLPQELANYAVGVLADKKLKLSVGSCADISAKAKRLYKESMDLLGKCLTLKPLHPEIRSILPDILGYAGLPDDMIDAIKEAENMYDPLASTALATDFNKNLPARPSKRNPNASKTVPASTLAPIYHLLAEVLLNHNKGKEALPLLKKALSLHSTYGPALLDTAVAHSILKDRKNADKAIEEAINSGIMLKTHPKLRQLVEYMDKEEDAQELRQQGKHAQDPSSVSKLRRHGQPPNPPKSMRPSKQDDGVPTNSKTFKTGKAPKGQPRGMSREQAENLARERMSLMNEEEFMEDVKARITERLNAQM